MVGNEYVNVRERVEVVKRGKEGLLPSHVVPWIVNICERKPLLMRILQFFTETLPVHNRHRNVFFNLSLYRLQLMRYEKQTYISKSVVHTIVKPARMFCFVCIIDSRFQVCYCYLHFNIKTAAKASHLLYLAFSYMKDIWFINLISFSPHWILEWFGMEWKLSYSLLLYKPTIFYLFKVKNGNTRTICEICSKLTINIPERRHWLQFEQISHIVLLFPLSTFSK